MPATAATERQRYLYRLLGRLAIRVALVVVLYFIVTFLPRPASLSLWMGPVAAAVLVLAVLMLVGSVLYDTLFFDRYWRAVDSK
ncbi:MAG: hypothetical protein OXU67_05305 [Chloroflexota bacterium]|nr:hypothetical protein [Chloroflexota bacterium]